ncbi:M48 family metalloprotease [Uliginosibacterium sp. H3]|uniref:M48 family metalloprotease n=1 Tax=Uliginosibacterium silvisoli TaxID=3114758 RepID=A0ABU6JYF6_9RHOO|nr:M48 family metalloprotease [Uliginosibacterium sp. H3]
MTRPAAPLRALRHLLAGAVLTLTASYATAAGSPCMQVAGPPIPDLRSALVGAQRGIVAAEPGSVPGKVSPAGIQTLRTAYARISQAAKLSPVLLLCDSKQLNAFAGYLRADLPAVAFEAQLLTFLQDNEGEVASVLGHEFAHILLGHALQRARAEAILSRSDASPEQKQLAFSRFSREKESRADEKGFSLAVSLAGYPADSQQNAVGKLLRESGTTHATYLDSHPGWLERKNKATHLSSNQHYIAQARQLGRTQNMRALGELTQTWLQAFPDSGAGWYYRGIYLIRQNKNGSGVTKAFETAVNNYLGSTDLGALAQEDEAEVDYAWLQLCSALFAEGYREESLNCHGRIRSAALREDFARRTFDSHVIVAGDRQNRSDIWLARSASGSKLITNDESIAASNKQYAKLPPTWTAMRFPAANMQDK